MSTPNDGGPAFRCSRCGGIAVRKQGHQWLCAKHYRFGQMRSRAKRDGKAVPTHEQLDAMLGDSCGDCGVVMNLLSRVGQRARTASLQHYRDGSMAIVCVSCNTRHAFMPGDSYRSMPKGHKRCPKCKTEKPIGDFSADNNRSGPMKVKSHCKTCSHDSIKQWRKDNRDHYNTSQREGRARRASC